jgi:hypothetical protein
MYIFRDISLPYKIFSIKELLVEYKVKLISTWKKSSFPFNIQRVNSKHEYLQYNFLFYKIRNYISNKKNNTLITKPKQWIVLQKT